MDQLQSIVFPKPRICFDVEMFFRFLPVEGSKCVYHLNTEKAELVVDKGGAVRFDTYFNSLSVGKWDKYTNVKRYSIQIKVKGVFLITLLHIKYMNGAIVEKELGLRKVAAESCSEITMDFPVCESVGLITFRISSLKDESVFYGGYYLPCEMEQEPRAVKLALNICNYNRENYIYRNIDLIKRYILNDPDDDLKDHLAIFIADNSSTIDSTKLPGIASVYPQGDYGGAGGFTRGLMEILWSKEKENLTHVVMMDDDILIEPESLKRLYAFLRHIKKEYYNAFVGGALMRLEHMHIQTCHGVSWDVEHTYHFHKVNSDLHLLHDILLNEIEDGAKINAWWFHCIPLTEVSLDNLPYPLFFHMDDVEFDLRNCKRVIHLNGIGVWHEPFEYKPGSHLYYYNTRNIYITYCIHYANFNTKAALRFLWKEYASHLLIYRYKEAELVLRGVEDMLRGPEWLVAQNPEQLLEDILAQGYKKRNMEQLPIRLDYERYLSSFHGGAEESRWRRLIRKATLNGYLCPAKGDAIVPMFAPMIRTVYRAKTVLNYDPITDRGFITEKSYKEAWKSLRHYWKVRCMLKKGFSAVRAEYLNQFSKMTSAAFWQEYLQIDKNAAGREDE